MKILKNRLNPGDIFLDIGANIGFYSLLASDIIGKGGSIFSFEPDKRCIQKPSEPYISINNVENIKSFNIALSDYDGEGFLSEKPENNSGWTHLTNSSSNESRRVDIVKLDTFVENKNIPKIDLIKIDTEGYELNVLKGGVRSITKFKPDIMLELNPKRT